MCLGLKGQLLPRLDVIVGSGKQGRAVNWPALRGLTPDAGKRTFSWSQPKSDKPSEQHPATTQVSFQTAVGDISEKEEITFLESAGSLTTCQGAPGSFEKAREGTRHDGGSRPSNSANWDEGEREANKA